MFDERKGRIAILSSIYMPQIARRRAAQYLANARATLLARKVPAAS